jgi:DNA-directed RNA polymerase specialized sigma24 family protein
MGRAIIKSYKEDWLPNKKQIDRIIEDMVMSGNWLDENRVQGGDRVPAAEKLLQIKENNREYIGLVRKIERMAKILEGMTEEQRAIMESYHWKGVPWYECAKRLNVSQKTFYRRVDQIDEKVGAEWSGESVDEEC